MGDLMNTSASESDGLGYGDGQVAAMGDQIKRAVFALEVGETISFERHNPDDQEDGRWFTVSKPIQRGARDGEAER